MTDARELHGGFRLGEWLIEPQRLRACRGSVAMVVSAEHMQVLLCLVESKGEFVDRRALCARIYPNDPQADSRLREAIKAWHAIFGDSARRPRYIATAGRDGYSVVAHFEVRKRMPIPERLMAAGIRNMGAAGSPQKLVVRAHSLLGEFRRRQVFSVTASYLIGMWILLQVAEVTFAPLHFPSWWITGLTILAVMGIPIIVVLAWTYEITPDGVVRDSVDVAEASFLPPMRRAVAPAILVGVVLMAAVTGYAWWESIQ